MSTYIQHLNLLEEDRLLYVKSLEDAKKYIKDVEANRDSDLDDIIIQVTLGIIDLLERILVLGAELCNDKDITALDKMDYELGELYEKRDDLENDYHVEKFYEDQEKKASGETKVRSVRSELKLKSMFDYDRVRLRKEVSECILEHAKSHAMIVRDKYKIIESWKTFPNEKPDDAIMLYHMHQNMMLRELYSFEALVVARKMNFPLRAVRPPGGFVVDELDFVMNYLEPIISTRIDKLKWMAQHSLDMLHFWEMIDLNDDYRLNCLANLFAQGTIFPIVQFEESAASPWKKLHEKKLINIVGTQIEDEATVMQNHVNFLNDLQKQVDTYDAETSSHDDCSFSMFSTVLKRMKIKNQRMKKSLVGFHHSLDEELVTKEDNEKSVVTKGDDEKSVVPENQNNNTNEQTSTPSELYSAVLVQINQPAAVEKVKKVKLVKKVKKITILKPKFAIETVHNETPAKDVPPETVFKSTEAAGTEDISEFAKSFYASSMMDKYKDMSKMSNQNWHRAKKTFKGSFDMNKVQEAIDLLKYTEKPLKKVESSPSKNESQASTSSAVQKTPVKKSAKQPKSIPKRAVESDTSKDLQYLAEASAQNLRDTNSELKATYDELVCTYRSKSLTMPLELATRMAMKFVKKRSDMLEEDYFRELDRQEENKKRGGQNDIEEDSELPHDLSFCKSDTIYLTYMALDALKELMPENMIWELCMLTSEFAEPAFITLEAVFINSIQHFVSRK